MPASTPSLALDHVSFAWPDGAGKTTLLERLIGTGGSTAGGNDAGSIGAESGRERDAAASSLRSCTALLHTDRVVYLPHRRRHRAPARPVGQDGGMNQLTRPLRGRWIAGVCLALAHRFGMSVTTVRVLTLIAMVFFGLPLWVYIVLWVLIPTER